MRIEEAAALEEGEDAALEDGREGAGVVGGAAGWFVEADVAVRAIGEDAVEDDDVEVGDVGGAGTASPNSEKKLLTCAG